MRGLNIGKIPEWPNGADCKSAGARLRWFESISSHYKATPSEMQRSHSIMSEAYSERCIFAEVAQLIEQ